MSVVRKYQTGGKTNPYEDYEAFIAKKLNENKFTAKALPVARKAASRFVGMAKSGNLDKAYSYDPIKDEYNVDTTSLPDELKSEVWGGSKDAINTNAFGQFNARGDKSNRGEEYAEDKKFNTLLSSWTNEFLASKKSQAPASKGFTGGGTAKRKSLTEYVGDNVFKGSNDAFNTYAETIEDNDGMKKEIMGWALENLDEYSKSYKDNELKEGSDRIEFESIGDETAIRQAIQDGDWTGFVQHSAKLGWNATGLLKGEEEEMSDDDKNALATKESNEKLIDNLKGRGIYDETILADILSKGFTLDDSNSIIGAPEGMDWFSDWMTKSKSTLLKNEHGHQAIVNSSGYFDKIFEDPDATGYGTYFQHNEGILDFQTNGMENWKKPVNPIDGQFGKRAIQGTVDGYGGWTIEGWPSKDGEGFGMNDVGNVDYTKHLTLKNPQTGESKELTFQDGQYKDSDGNIIEGVNIEKYSGATALPIKERLDDTSDPFNTIEGKAVYESITETKAAIDKIVEQGGVKRGDENTLRAVVEDLRYRIKNSDSVLERQEAAALYSNLIGGQLDKEEIAKVLKVNESDMNSGLMSKVETDAELPAAVKAQRKLSNPLSFLNKKGGVLKAQSGAKMSFEDYLAKHPANIAKTDTKGDEPVKQLSNLRGSFKDANALDIISLVGTGASFIPGVGVIGGAVMTGADLINDINDSDGDGKINWGRHAANVGFTALSAVGLGALKGVNLAAKAAKAGDKAFDVTKMITKAGKVSKVTGSKTALWTAERTGKVAKSLGGVDEIAALSAKLRKTKDMSKFTAKEVDALKKLNIHKGTKGFIKRGKSIDGKKVASALEKDLQATKDIANISTLGPTAQKAKDIATKFSQFKAAPWIKGAGVATVAVPAGMSAMSIAEDIKEGGIGSVKLDDAKSVMMLGSLGLNRYMNKRVGKAVKKYSKTEDGAVKLMDGKKEIGTLKSEIDLPKKKLNPFAKKDKKELLEMKSALKKAGFDDDQIKSALKAKKLKVTTEKESVKGFKNADEVDFSKPGQNIKEYEKARQKVEGKVGNYGLPSEFGRWYKSFEKGGVLKLQGGGKKDFSVWPDWGYKKRMSPEERESFDKRNSVGHWFERNSAPAVYSKWDWSKGEKSKEEKPKVYGATKMPDFNVDYGYPRRPEYVPPHIARNLMGKEAKVVASNSVPEAQLGVRQEAIVKREPIREMPLMKSIGMDEALTGMTPNQTAPVLATSNSGTGDGTIGSAGVKDKNLFKGKFKINPADMANLAMYANTLRANGKAAKAQKRAAMAGIVRGDLTSKQYFRTKSPYAHYYDKQAAKLGSLGKRMMETTADIDKGFGARLSAEAQAMGLREKGNQLDQENVQNTIDKQMQSDLKVDANNNAVVAKNRASIANAEKSVHLVDSNKYVANSTAFNNLATATNRNREVQAYKDKYAKFYEASTNPEIQKTLDSYKSVNEQEATAKEAWETAMGKKDVAYKRDNPWEKTSAAINFKNERSRLDKLMQHYNTVVNNARLNTQMPTYATGGTLAEKEYLAKLRNKHSKQKEVDKKYFKMILSNNELMHKSLIKIFK